MWFGYLTLAVAFFLSVVAAYYSVLGLVAIFSAAAIPVIIMGGALETGKVVAAMWLHRNWHRAPWTYKAYLLPSLLALMLLTSMGTFGYLSKAHSDQSLVSGDVTSKIALYDEKIKIARENIDANRRSLKQMDEAVDQTMGRSTTEQGADKAVQVRRSQARERTRLLSDIEAEQKKITELNEARAPIAAEVRKVEAEVGPIKYIAALLYGDNPETNLLESAVRWVIILIVIVFDPLAIVLILAGTRHLEWERAARLPAVVLELETTTATSSTTTTTTTTTAPPTPPEQVYLLQPGTWFKWRPFETTTTTTTTEAPLPPYELLGDEFLVINNDKPVHYTTIKDKYPSLYNIVLDLRARQSVPDATFGQTFPKTPLKGHMHVYTGTLPSKLYKFNGQSWIEVDKSVSDSYTHNEAYIKYLISQVDQGIVSIDDLTVAEQDLIKNYLENDKSTNNTTG